MKVLILGGSGMLGHQLWRVLRERFETHVTLRQGLNDYPAEPPFEASRAWPFVSVQDFDSVMRAVAGARPDVLVNCIGVIKQQAAANDPLAAISVNALFPHRLAELAAALGSRLIHISTDCVFSGQKGNYREADKPDPEDLYGQTKLLGEVTQQRCCTLRTSMIGRELGSSYGLLEWFLSQRGKRVRGYTQAIFSGLTTQALSEVIAAVISEHPDLNGLWHVASQPISKFDLLTLIKKIQRLDMELVPDASVVCDRSLNAERFSQATGLRIPSWPQMIEQLLV